MKQKLLSLVVFFSIILMQKNTYAQATVLLPGDIAFIGYQTSSPSGDGFSFITLKPINIDTKIYFTEKGWGGTTWVTGSTEPHLLWTAPAFIPEGTIVSVVETPPGDVFTITGSSGFTIAQGTGFNLSGGDQILAYQSTTGAEPASPTFIAGIHGDYNSTKYDASTTWNTAWNGTIGATGGNESALPKGLTNGVNCISLFPGITEIANAKYNGSLSGSVATLLSNINNRNNWSFHASNDLGIIPSGFSTPVIYYSPTVSSTAATSISTTSAILGGNVTNNGGTVVKERGIVWGTTTDPTISNNKVSNGTGNGTFTGTITSLPSNTTIYFRAYAINDVGTSYGSSLSFKTAVANTAPVLASIGNKYVNEGSQLTFTATATDAEANALTYSLISAPAGASITTIGHLLGHLQKHKAQALIHFQYVYLMVH